MSAAAKNGAGSRQKAGAEPFDVRFGGETFTFPAKPPFRVLKHLAGGGEAGLVQLVALATDLLGDEQMEKFYSLDFDLEKGSEKLGALLAKGIKNYGMTLGEAPASQSS